MAHRAVILLKDPKFPEPGSRNHGVRESPESGGAGWERGECAKWMMTMPTCLGYVSARCEGNFQLRPFITPAAMAAAVVPAAGAAASAFGFRAALTGAAVSGLSALGMSKDDPCLATAFNKVVGPGTDKLTDVDGWTVYQSENSFIVYKTDQVDFMGDLWLGMTKAATLGQAGCMAYIAFVKVYDYSDKMYHDVSNAMAISGSLHIGDVLTALGDADCDFDRIEPEESLMPFGLHAHCQGGRRLLNEQPRNDTQKFQVPAAGWTIPKPRSGSGQVVLATAILVAGAMLTVVVLVARAAVKQARKLKIRAPAAAEHELIVFVDPKE